MITSFNDVPVTFSTFVIVWLLLKASVLVCKPRFTTAPWVPSLNITVSSSAPPFIVSIPSWSWIVSFPASPDKLFVPVPPQMVSSLSPPLITSFPASPYSLSFPDEPVKLSAPSPP